jgi:hypothetical protein
MHLLEQYSLASGVKIKKPYIYEKFFPVTADKYITFHPSSKPSKTYDYWQEVINLISPILNEKGIKIIQLGQEKEKVYSNVLSFVGLTNINQTAFILRDSLLHFGADSFPTHIASGYGKKIVALYSNNYVNCVKPFFGNPKDHVLLEPKRANKPTFSFEEYPKTINSIKPEEIANNILNLLGIPHVNSIQTLYFGSEYNNMRLEMVPNQIVNPKQFNSNNIVVRMDLEHNEKFLNEQLQVCQCFIITDKPIDPNIIINNRKNVGRIFYEIKENDNIAFADFLAYSNISYQLFTYLEGKKLEEIKLKYLDQEHITQMQTNLKKKTGIEYTSNAFYKSNKRLISNGKVYLSESSLKNGIEAKQIAEPVIDCPEFWKEVENFWIFRVDKSPVAA